MRAGIILFLSAIHGLLGYAQSLDDLSTTVCHVQDRKPVIESVDGKIFELWLKEPNSTNYYPKSVTYKGTGFFLRGKKLGYLVTAKHVAENLSPNSVITIGTSNQNESMIISFGSLRGTMPIPWIYHGQADVSILPFWLSPDYISRYLSRHLLELDCLVLEAISPSRDVELTILGFPWGLGVGPDLFSPISKLKSLERPYEGRTWRPIFHASRSIHRRI
jgi:hypothetical protein